MFLNFCFMEIINNIWIKCLEKCSWKMLLKVTVDFFWSVLISIVINWLLTLLYEEVICNQQNRKSFPERMGDYELFVVLKMFITSKMNAKNILIFFIKYFTLSSTLLNKQIDGYGYSILYYKKFIINLLILYFKKNNLISKFFFNNTYPGLLKNHW